jgi:ATP-dependent Clp protease ATP-binding subunit ClpA
MARGQRLARLAAEAAQASTPREALRTTSELRTELDAFERRQVARALAEGMTFAQIARCLGVSRQAAHRRFRSLAGIEPPLATTAGVPRILGYAREESLALGARTTASEHVLLAILRAADLPAATLLRNAGATLERARPLVEAASSAPRVRRGRAADDLRALLAGAASQARRRDVRRIEVEDLLIGALEDERGGAVRTLRALGVDSEDVRAELATMLEAQLA